MRLALLGGSGRIDGHVLTWALRSGHEVTALARDPRSLPAAAGLTVIAGEATDDGAVAGVVAGTDVVLSALGPRGAKTPAVLPTAARATATAMEKTGTRRLICVSAAGVFIQSGGGKIARADVAHFLGVVLTDGSWIGARPAIAY